MNVHPHPTCPYCKSSNVTRANPRAFILAGVGGVLGGALMVLFDLSKEEKGEKRINVGSIIFGMFSGAMAGLGYGRGGRQTGSGRRYLCLDCLHFFTYFEYSKD